MFVFQWEIKGFVEILRICSANEDKHILYQMKIILFLYLEVVKKNQGRSVLDSASGASYHRKATLLCERGYLFWKRRVLVVKMGVKPLSGVVRVLTESQIELQIEPNQMQPCSHAPMLRSLRAPISAPKRHIFGRQDFDFF